MALHQSLLLLTFIPLAAALFAAPSTNVCGLEYNYCSKDPGCATYTMSVHDLFVQDLNSSKPVNISDVSLGSHLKLTVTGKTTITTVTKDGSYRIYALQGGNLAGGVLADVLTIDGKGGFAVSVEFTVAAELFNAKDKSKFEFGLDIFQVSCDQPSLDAACRILGMLCAYTLTQNAVCRMHPARSRACAWKSPVRLTWPSSKAISLNSFARMMATVTLKCLKYQSPCLLTRYRLLVVRRQHQRQHQHHLHRHRRQLYRALSSGITAN